MSFTALHQLDPILELVLAGPDESAPDGSLPGGIRRRHDMSVIAGSSRTKRETRNARDALAVERVRNGDHATFEELFFEHYAPLCDFAVRYVHDAAAAEDIVADVFGRLWSTRASLVVRVTLASYLYGAVRNRAFNYGRDVRAAESAHALYARESDEVARLETHAADASTTLERAELLHRLRALIAELPERRRVALELRWMHGMSYAEIADVMGTSVQTVANQLTRTLHGLRSLLPRDFR